MDDFRSVGCCFGFGLVGAEANAVGPRKRPLSSMSPTIVLKDGHPILSVGVYRVFCSTSDVHERDKFRPHHKASPRGRRQIE